MAISAIVDGIYKSAPFLSDEEALRIISLSKRNKNYILLESCGHPAIISGYKSKNITIHFRHRSRNTQIDCQTKPESELHRYLKIEIIKGALLAGWEARSEASDISRRWVADVLAEKENQKNIFEVQLSPQTYQEYVNRTQKYEIDGYRCLWFTKQRFANVKDFRHKNLDDITSISDFVYKYLKSQFLINGKYDLDKIFIPSKHYR